DSSCGEINTQFSLQPSQRLGSFSDVRSCLALCFFLAAPGLVTAQEQERKLVDRLLRPDTSLQNPSQDKKFIADGAPIDKRAPVGTFYLQQKPKPKGFSGGARDFPTQRMSPPSFIGSSGPKKFSSIPAASDSRRVFSTSRATDVKPVHDAKKMTSTRDFSGSRPFLDRGKSQKSLDQEKPSLTIEQVRELLNKNK
ncbi:MAG: hypothetical protein M3R29_05885, partial [Verrucomicrobiota bacterium]|nr:hypothetical protein [Verrucomicrobiota bacterium]